MIKVDVFIAKRNIKYSKNHTILEGEVYIGRMSKDGFAYVVRCEEGEWIKVFDYHWAKNTSKELQNNFEKIDKLFFKNRKELNNLKFQKRGHAND